MTFFAFPCFMWRCQYSGCRYIITIRSWSDLVTQKKLNFLMRAQIIVINCTNNNLLVTQEMCLRNVGLKPTHDLCHTRHHQPSRPPSFTVTPHCVQPQADLTTKNVTEKWSFNNKWFHWGELFLICHCLFIQHWTVNIIASPCAHQQQSMSCHGLPSELDSLHSPLRLKWTFILTSGCSPFVKNNYQNQQQKTFQNK